MAELCQAGLAGDIATARERHTTVAGLAELAFMDTNPIPAKTAMAALGKATEEFRLPLVPMADEQREILLVVCAAGASCDHAG